MALQNATDKAARMPFLRRTRAGREWSSVPNPTPALLVASGLLLTLIAVVCLQWRRSYRSEKLLRQQSILAMEEAGEHVHELNQPLTAILSNAQAGQRFLSAEPVDLQELRAIFEEIVQDDKRAASILRKLGTSLKENERMARSTAPPEGTK